MWHTTVILLHTHSHFVFLRCYDVLMILHMARACCVRSVPQRPSVGAASSVVLWVFWSEQEYHTVILPGPGGISPSGPLFQEGERVGGVLGGGGGGGGGSNDCLEF